MLYSTRTYRLEHHQDDLLHFQVSVKETDLDIGIRKDRFSKELVYAATNEIKRCREPLEEYIRQEPTFVRTLTPYEAQPAAPLVVHEMARAAQKAGVGPMAAVAGMIAEHVGRKLARYSRDVIVENGGDIFLSTSRIRYIGIFAGRSPLSHKLALEIKPSAGPLGICTSSGTVGHSFSAGKADAVIILSPCAALADAVATATANLVQDKKDLKTAVDFALNITGVTGAVAILGESLAAGGQVRLLPIIKQENKP